MIWKPFRKTFHRKWCRFGLYSFATRQTNCRRFPVGVCAVCIRRRSYIHISISNRLSSAIHNEVCIFNACQMITSHTESLCELRQRNKSALQSLWHVWRLLLTYTQAMRERTSINCAWQSRSNSIDAMDPSCLCVPWSLNELRGGGEGVNALKSK